MYESHKTVNVEHQHPGKSQKVVVIAASAGGIEALTKVLSDLPRDLPAALIIVQHLHRNHSTRLPEYLNHHSEMDVCLAKDRMTLRNGVAYIAEPGRHLHFEKGYLTLGNSEPVRYHCPSADVLFTSAAETFGPNVIGVVLTGTGRDGAQGCKAIKTKGGVIIVQDEETARYVNMPKEVIKAGLANYILPLNKIADKIVKICLAKKEE